MNVGEKIQICRKKKKLSQEELGELLLVSRQTVSLWETGQTLPTIDNLIRLKEIFEMPLDSILCDEKEVTPAPKEEYTVEMSTDELVNINAKFTKKHEKKLINRVIVFGAILLCSLMISAADFISGMAFCALLIFGSLIASSRRSLAKSKKLIEKRGAPIYHYEFYEKYILFELVKDNEVRETAKLYFDDIDEIYDMDDLTVICHKQKLYAIKSEQLPPSSKLFEAKELNGSYSKAALKNDKRKSLSLALIMVSLLSIYAANFVTALVSGGSLKIENTWIFYLFTPIPIWLIVHGIIEKSQKRKGVFNIVIGVLVLAVLCVYGSFFIIF